MYPSLEFQDTEEQREDELHWRSRAYPDPSDWMLFNKLHRVENPKANHHSWVEGIPVFGWNIGNIKWNDILYY